MVGSKVQVCEKLPCVDTNSSQKVLKTITSRLLADLCLGIDDIRLQGLTVKCCKKRQHLTCNHNGWCNFPITVWVWKVANKKLTKSARNFSARVVLRNFEQNTNIYLSEAISRIRIPFEKLFCCFSRFSKERNFSQIPEFLQTWKFLEQHCSLKLYRESFKLTRLSFCFHLQLLSFITFHAFVWAWKTSFQRFLLESAVDSNLPRCCSLHGFLWCRFHYALFL